MRCEWERLKGNASNPPSIRWVATALALGLMSVVVFSFALVDLAVGIWDILKWVIPGGVKAP